MTNWFQDPWFSDFGKDLVPALDILDHENEYEVHVSIPGIKEKKDIGLEYHKDSNEIVISGEIPDVTTEETKGSAKVRERRYGRFKRVVRLPETPGIDNENIKANYTNGVLVLNVPKLQDDHWEPKGLLDSENIHYSSWLQPKNGKNYINEISQNGAYITQQLFTKG